MYIQKEWVKSRRTSLKLITEDDTVAAIVLGLRYNNFSYAIQRNLRNDHAYVKLWARKIDKKCMSNFLQ